jgi:hypothetical protein
MKLLIVLAILLTAPGALACELSLVTPARSVLKNPVQAKAWLADDTLTVRYSVSSPSLNARKVLGPQQHPYLFDVVELFVTFSETTSRGCRFGSGVICGYSAGWLERGVEDPPKTAGLGWRSQENPGEFLFHSGARATELLEFIPAESQKGELSSAAVFSAVAAM